MQKDSWPDAKHLNATFIYSTVSFALALLLVFKTNSSFARYFEARSAWGRNFIVVRNLIRKIQTYAPHAPTPLRQALTRWCDSLAILCTTLL